MFVPPLLAYFAVQPCTVPGGQLFFLPHWWEYLNTTGSGANCIYVFSFPGDILPVALAIVDMLLRVAGLVAIISIIIAGVTYMTAGGQVDKTAAAKKRIYNSLAGLAIVAVAAAAVGFIGNSLNP